MDQAGIEHAARILRGARRAVVLTGAGFSKPSGIPDFRSEDGLWAHDDPAEVASLRSFWDNPQRFYTWFRPLLEHILAAQPNPAHLALAELEQRATLQAVVTQNIDGLHQRGGSREVYELHGHLRSATCIWCERQVPSDPLLARMRRGELPRCGCGGAYKPDVVLFDEPLPRGLVWLAQRAIDSCDALIVAGTSLEVAPVSDLPLRALRRGVPIIIVNLGATYLDARASIILREDVAQALPAIVAELRQAA